MNKKILIVDDDLEILKSIGDMLEDEGYEVETASTGHQALKILKENPEKFDLVVLDILLPDTDGIRLLKIIKSGIKPPFVIMYSWYDYRDDFAIWASEDYIIKSKESKGKLLSVIKKLLKD